ncbi:L-threonylcarbamoyladenylate synthase [Pseudoduganella plicata]|uniref:Threonylcarbamoyl-AMP synthase n=1 Tax=Pseudoduganella plicata TaxID=321984 RepID=A0A4P7BFP9_9BURK|nr:L-threonylcarbamoyladenylate synthase [Pseudoduganella plicata]QBQ37043.1 threonylcarbamoyl-AMP synthase [Pseudoduganella plicata]GGY99827.1 threonylcarbamoyl-AMP synthase [Pseudoduganella plicata]
MSTQVSAIEQAARKLEAGGLVAFPTETVYGLGADAENPVAVASIYAAKGRPNDHPVIVHLAPGADLDYWASAIPDEARRLVAAFWPGPLTLILKRHAHIPDAVSGGQDTVGLRCPSHPVAMALLSAFKGGKGGVAAPSANKFGNVSPTAAQHVQDEFDASAGITVLDGGSSQVGIESTILDLSRLDTHGPVLLRPGHIGAAQIAAVIGAMPVAPDASAPRASGTLESHYAPKAPVALLSGDQVAGVLNALADKGRRVALIHYSPLLTRASAQHPLPEDPAGYAHGIYAALRAMDGTDAELILVESPPQDDSWLGINDRLRRAAHGAHGTIDRLLA